jgi:hypothetical protein
MVLIFGTVSLGSGGRNNMPIVTRIKDLETRMVRRFKALMVRSCKISNLLITCKLGIDQLEKERKHGK